LTDFRKIFKYQIHEIPSNGNRDVPCGWTDMTKLIVTSSQFCERALKNMLIFAVKYAMKARGGVEV
jgi:hypothetical protein